MSEPTSTPKAAQPVFRQQALEHYQRGLQAEGDVLHIAPGWTRWVYWVVAGMMVMVCIYTVVGTLYEYASGPAVVRVEGHTDLTVTAGGVVDRVEVEPGQWVEAGQVLVTFLATEERSHLERLQHEFELHLVRYMRDPTDQAARQALTSLRAERELAEARLQARTLVAPHAGTVGDLRIQPGQYLQPGTRALSLLGEHAQVFMLAFLPGHARPFLQPGMILRSELLGFRYEYQELEIDSIGDQVIGPNELRRYLGADLADSVSVEGAMVLVRARIRSPSFQSEGREFNYFDGMPARAEARLRAEPILTLLIPGLKAVLPHDG